MTAGTVSVRVLDGWAVYDGHRQHGGGSVVEVPLDLARRWIAAGWAKQVSPPAPKSKARTT